MARQVQGERRGRVRRGVRLAALFVRRDRGRAELPALAGAPAAHASRGHPRAAVLHAARDGPRDAPELDGDEAPRAPAPTVSDLSAAPRAHAVHAAALGPHAGVAPARRDLGQRRRRHAGLEASRPTRARAELERGVASPTAQLGAIANAAMAASERGHVLEGGHELTECLRGGVFESKRCTRAAAAAGDLYVGGAAPRAQGPRLPLEPLAPTTDAAVTHDDAGVCPSGRERDRVAQVGNLGGEEDPHGRRVLRGFRRVFRSVFVPFVGVVFVVRAPERPDRPTPAARARAARRSGRRLNGVGRRGLSRRGLSRRRLVEAELHAIVASPAEHTAIAPERAGELTTGSDGHHLTERDTRRSEDGGGRGGVAALSAPKLAEPPMAPAAHAALFVERADVEGPRREAARGNLHSAGPHALPGGPTRELRIAELTEAVAPPAPHLPGRVDGAAKRPAERELRAGRG